MTPGINFAGLIVTATVLLLLCVNNARADSITGQIESLIAADKLEQALSLTEQQLAGDADNVNYLFLKGLILTRQNNMEDARDTFVRLTKDHPELPEPYNNLAVIYAAQGDFANARSALEQAINTHPSYATAHENLGDIYAKMASNAYNHALEIDSDNVNAREKLALINNLFSTGVQLPRASEDGGRPAPAGDKEELSRLENQLTALTESNNQLQERARALQAELQRLETQRQQAALQSQQENQAAQQQLIQTRRQMEQLKTQLAQQENQRELPARQAPAAAPATAVTTLAADAEAVKQEVIRAVREWAAHWSARDVEGYVSSYAANYFPPELRSRRQWLAQRRSRITRPTYIKVAIENPRVDLMGVDQARINFDQNYQSDQYRDRVHKTLQLKRDNGRWLIVEEQSG